jgi:hypothetical protein
VVLLLALASPLLALAAALGNGAARKLLAHRRDFAAVLGGSRALVGYRDAPDAEPAQRPYGIPEAAFDVSESLPRAARTPGERRRLYAFYREHRSAALDLQILARALRHA